jgi:hypothetical protein
VEGREIRDEERQEVQKMVKLDLNISIKSQTTFSHGPIIGIPS